MPNFSDISDSLDFCQSVNCKHLKNYNDGKRCFLWMTLTLRGKPIYEDHDCPYHLERLMMLEKQEHKS